MFLKRHEDAIDTFKTGLAVDPANKQLKESLEECMASQGPKQFGNPFTDPSMIFKLRNDPRTAKWMDDPEYLKLIHDMQSDPKNLGFVVLNRV